MVSVYRLCSRFKASRSETLAWLTRGPSKRDVSNEKKRKRIKQFHGASTGWLVVFVVMDFYSRKLARWCFRSTMASHITTRALAMESFFGTLKQELVHQVKVNTRRSAIQDIFLWIETWYNRHRRHSYLGYESQDNFEKASLRPQPITITAHLSYT